MDLKLGHSYESDRRKSRPNCGLHSLPMDDAGSHLHLARMQVARHANKPRCHSSTRRTRLRLTVIWFTWGTGRTRGSRSSTQMADSYGSGTLGIRVGLVITPDHFLYMCDAIAARILKIDPLGKVVGSFNGPRPGQERTSTPTKSHWHRMVRYLRRKL